MASSHAVTEGGQACDMSVVLVLHLHINSLSPTAYQCVVAGERGAAVGAARTNGAGGVPDCHTAGGLPSLSVTTFLCLPCHTVSEDKPDDGATARHTPGFDASSLFAFSCRPSASHSLPCPLSSLAVAGGGAGEGHACFG
ncbi:unnamed protein product [Closterium sp. NIES-65]|nr:unnamed protein product [Closterium sp. NIES-65]CAI6009699.1 unnamed protein product [Closterium sp. NIES-65]